MANRPALLKIVGSAIFCLLLAALTAGQVSQTQMPDLPESALLPDIFRATQQLQERFKAVEFKEQVSFRLAAVVIAEGHANRNVDFRQSADYAVTVRPGQLMERKFIQSGHVPQFG